MAHGDDPEPADEFEVRVFTLAEWAHAAPTDGTLTIGRGGLTRVAVPELPATLPLLYLVARVRVPASWAGQPVQVQIRVLDAAGAPLERDPVVDARAAAGRTTGLEPDPELSIQFVLAFGGLPVRAEGLLFFHLLVAGEELATLPLRIARAPARPATA